MDRMSTFIISSLNILFNQSYILLYCHHNLFIKLPLVEIDFLTAINIYFTVWYLLSTSFYIKTKGKNTDSWTDWLIWAKQKMNTVDVC